MNEDRLHKEFLALTRGMEEKDPEFQRIKARYDAMRKNLLAVSRKHRLQLGTTVFRALKLMKAVSPTRYADVRTESLLTIHLLTKELYLQMKEVGLIDTEPEEGTRRNWQD